MFLFLAVMSRSFASEVCHFDGPISIVELREALKTCHLVTGTTITMQIVDVPPNETQPGIGFLGNDISLNDNGKEVLDGVSFVLFLRKKMKIAVVGYADSSEQGDLLDLSLRRAQAAADYLVSKGVEKERITVNAAGAENPIDTSGTSEGRARNRRIEFVVSAL